MLPYNHSVIFNLSLEDVNHLQNMAWQCHATLVGMDGAGNDGDV